eukprot:s119_g8.t1
MSSIVVGTPLAFLRNVNDVVELTVDMGENLILHCKYGDSPNLVRHFIDGGMAAFAQIRNAVADNLSEEGNNHWATQVDIDILSRELQICFYTFGNEPVSQPAEGSQEPANVLHSFAASVDSAEVSICLYNISFQHFQSLFLDLETGCRSAFLRLEIPASLADALRTASG